MKLAEYINAKRGNAIRLASILGISPSYISQMASGYRAISPDRCIPIERATNGQVTRFDLRPTDAHLIWPEQAAAREQEVTQ